MYDHQYSRNYFNSYVIDFLRTEPFPLSRKNNEARVLNGPQILLKFNQKEISGSAAIRTDRKFLKKNCLNHNKTSLNEFITQN